MARNEILEYFKRAQRYHHNTMKPQAYPTYLQPWENPTTVENMLRSATESIKGLGSETDYTRRDRARLKQLEILRGTGGKA